MNIMIKGFMGKGINGVQEICLETNSRIDWGKDIQQILAINHKYDDYPKSKFHGYREYIIPTKNILFMVE